MDRRSRIILRSIARAAFVSSWADRAEEKGRRFPPQTELMDVAPKRTSKAANEWAREVAKILSNLNAGATLATLYDGAQIFYGYSDNEDRFGHELGMQTMGHGVSWHDSLPHGVYARGNPIHIAHIGFWE